MPKPPAFDAVLFDIDNVLIDTSRSYMDAIRWTVEIYLTTDSVPFFMSPAPGKKISVLSPDDVNQFKLLGGFNDDWDCCYGMLIYLTTLNVKPRTTAQLKRIMNIRRFSQSIKERPLRVSGITRRLGHPQAVKIEKIARIFQEVYLGRDLFRMVERKPCAFWKKRGLIHREKLIFRKSTLAKLKKMGIALGIATGRPRFEAVYSLKRFGVLDYFDTITTIDEVKRAEQQQKQSLRKPHPYSLIETAKRIGISKRFLYVGDLPDDIFAATQAKDTFSVRSVAFPWYSANSRVAMEEVKKAKPDFILKKASLLPKLVQRGSIA